MDHFRRVERERHSLKMWKWWQAAVAEPEHGTTSIEEAFQLLRVRDRALLWLAYVEEASHAEIAAALGCGARSVRVLLFRARRRMERILREHNICSGD
jgi:RNA polymerase sigma-70 factor (ECF subfamily)